MRYLLFLLTLLVSACTPTRYAIPTEPVVMEAVKVEQKATATIEREKVYVHDSVFMKIAGDTIYTEKWHTRWRDREVHDTLYLHRVDSIPYKVEVPVIQEVEKPPSAWTRFFTAIGRFVIFAAAGILIGFIISKLRPWKLL